MSLDSVPYIGRYSARTDGLYAVTGFNKWGMTSAMAAAMALCELVQGRDSPYAALFSPSRSILRPPTGNERSGGSGRPAHAYGPPLPPLGLRAEI